MWVSSMWFPLRVWGNKSHRYTDTHFRLFSPVSFTVFTGFLTVHGAAATVWWLVSGEWNSLLECQRASEIEREWEREHAWGKEGGRLNGEKNSTEVISCSSYELRVERCWRKNRKIVFVWKQKKWKEKKDILTPVDSHLETVLQTLSLICGYK